MIEVAAIRAVAMIVCINVGPNLDSAQLELAYTTRQFLRGKIDILQWDSPETNKSRRVSPNDLGDVVVQQTTEIKRIPRLCPIAEHHRNRREHLDRNAGAVHFLDPALCVPHVLVDFAKNAVTDHHPR